MKKSNKFTIIPNSFWATPDLSLTAKWVAISIDSFCDSQQGVTIGTTALATDTNLSAKQVKEALKELQSKGAMDVNVGADGEKCLKVYLYKERYMARGEQVVIGDKPTDAAVLPYEQIMQMWNEHCPMLPKLTRMTPQRKNKTRTCLKSCECSVDDLFKAIQLVGCSAFLNGTKNSGWAATYDWIIKSPANLTKILEGNYHNKDFAERKAYESIMMGDDVNQRDDFYK